MMGTEKATSPNGSPMRTMTQWVRHHEQETAGRESPALLGMQVDEC